MNSSSQFESGWARLYVAEYKRCERSDSHTTFVSQCTRDGRLVARLLRAA